MNKPEGDCLSLKCNKSNQIHYNIYILKIAMMNAKLPGKGKGKGKGMKMDSQIMKKIVNQYEGSLDSSYYVQAKMDYVGRWFKSKILGCRLAKDYDASKKKDQSCYQYYIHYEPLNRRNDEWVSFDHIRKTSEKIFEEDHKKKGNKKTQQKKDDKYTEHEGMDHNSVLVHQQVTKFKTIHRIQMGQYKAETWYHSPYPIYYHNIDCLYICEFCLSFFCLEKQLKRHSVKCPLFHPPGDQIYRDFEEGLAVFEVDGLKNPLYCENLAFLSKLYLDHKNLQWDMSVFHFYVMCEIVQSQYHIAGYFSKPKQSEKYYNLSCILVLPFYQRKGYGKFLITFSYELSMIQGRIGTPQKPLSDLGKQTYLAWWSQRLIDFIRRHKNEAFTLENMIKETGMMQEDIQWTLEQCGMLKTSGGQAVLCVDEALMSQVYKKAGRQGKRVLRQNIHWIPFKIKWQGQPIA